MPGSAADRAGVERGDVIISFNGTKVEGANDLRNHVAGTAPGSKVTITVLCHGQTRTLTADLGELSGKRAAADDKPGESDRGKLGLMVKPLTPAIVVGYLVGRGVGMDLRFLMWFGGACVAAIGFVWLSL